MAAGPNASQMKAGNIAARVLDETCASVKAGMKLISLCTSAEKRIIELGGRPAFPCNVSINHVAAHYTSPHGDFSVIPDFGLVKVDVGVHVDGHIADTAKTVDIDGTLDGFVSATDDALNEAIAAIRPGMTVSEVGGVIEKTIKAYGLRAVRELTGHSLERFRLHAGKQVPNFASGESTKIEAGETFAIEPFATSGMHVGDSKNIYIFSNTGLNKSLTGVTEKLREHLRKQYGPLPFASRWVGTSEAGIDLAAEFAGLLKSKVIRGYPVLVEKNNRPVSQSEHTVFVSEEGASILTKRT